uniref:DUF5110 domain-containing protein n=1 Tax=Steinernema glaseri TaxID=37863 RepID=A0A1I8AIU3_9BILA
MRSPLVQLQYPCAHIEFPVHSDCGVQTPPGGTVTHVDQGPLSVTYRTAGYGALEGSEALGGSRERRRSGTAWRVTVDSRRTLLLPPDTAVSILFETIGTLTQRLPAYGIGHTVHTVARITETAEGDEVPKRIPFSAGNRVSKERVSWVPEGR